MVQIVKLTNRDIKDIFDKQKEDKSEFKKPDKLLISLDNFILDEKTFSNCPFRSITIVSGNNIENLCFKATGNTLRRIGVGKFPETNKNVPSDWKGKFPKLKKIEALNCAALEKLMVKSSLDADINHDDCPKFNEDADIGAKKDADKFFDEKGKIEEDTLENYQKNTSQRLANSGFKVEKFLGRGKFGVVWKCRKGNELYAAKVVCNNPKKPFDAISEEKIISDNIWDNIEGDLWKEGLAVNKSFQATKSRGIFIAPLASKKDVYKRALPDEKDEREDGKKRGQGDFRSIRDVQDFMQSLLKSLNKLHSSGLVHRDIKPENILVNKSGDKFSYSIGDFGLSQHKDDPRVTNMLCGSRMYMPPETGFKNGRQLRGRTYASFEAAQKGDVFALGRTFMARLFQVLSGQLGYQLFFKQNPSIPRNKSTQEGVKQVISLIEDMMSDNPDKRPTTAEALSCSFFRQDYDKI